MTKVIVYPQRFVAGVGLVLLPVCFAFFGGLAARGNCCVLNYCKTTLYHYLNTGAGYKWPNGVAMSIASAYPEGGAPGIKYNLSYYSWTTSPNCLSGGPIFEANSAGGNLGYAGTSAQSLFCLGGTNPNCP